VPPEHDPELWRPTIEAAAAVIATATHGDRVPVLTGHRLGCRPGDHRSRASACDHPEQTVPDLGRLDLRGEDVEAQEVIDTLWAECEQAVLADIVSRQRMQATLGG
jgi:hypothetical protein